MADVATAPRPSLRLLFGLAAVTLVGAGLRMAAAVLVPLALALFLAILAWPLVGALIRRRVPVWLAVVLTMIVLGGAIAGFWLLLLGSLGEARELAPVYLRDIQSRVAVTVEWWRQKGIAIDEWIPERWSSPESVLELAGGTLAGTLRAFSTGTIIVLTLVFLLFEAVVLPSKLARLPGPIRERLDHFANVSRELQRYLAIKTMVAAAIGVAAGLWLAFLDVDFPVLCALLAFAFHFVPNVGAILAAGPPMLLALVQFDPAVALTVGVGYLVIGLVLGNLLEPALLGRRLNLSPLVVFVSLIVWGWLWGAAGMFLSVPLTMAIKILLEHSEDWSWMALLLGGQPKASARQAPSEPSEGEASVPSLESAE